MAIHPLLGIELFSGTGMLGEGLRAGIDYLGIPYRTVCHVEREAHAASVLVARIQEGSLDEAPIWSDVTTFNARRWRGKVDCIIAGFPCQDLSVAGKRAGLDGKRSGLFFEVTRIATDSGAWLMLLENVAGIATATASVVDAEEGELDERAASRVVGELADLGWDAEWIVISASDVGANHGRARWFCVAWRKLGNAESEREIWQADEQRRSSAFGCSGEQMGNAEHAGRNAAEIGGGAVQRNDGNETRTICTGEPSRSSISDEKLDNPISIGRGTRRMPDGEHDRNIAAAASEVVVADDNQQRPQHSWTLGQQAGNGESENSGVELAYACGARSASGIPRQNTREEGNASLAIHCGDGHQLADSDCARLEGVKCGRRSDSSGGGQQNGSTSERCGLFAPGPSDPRWSEIIREFPHLAPALDVGADTAGITASLSRAFRSIAPGINRRARRKSARRIAAAFARGISSDSAKSDVRMLVNGLAFDMGDSRAARLKCVGNGVVPLSAAIATVVLARRAGLFG